MISRRTAWVLSAVAVVALASFVLRESRGASAPESGDNLVRDERDTNRSALRAPDKWERAAWLTVRLVDVESRRDVDGEVCLRQGPRRPAQVCVPTAGGEARFQTPVIGAVRILATADGYRAATWPEHLAAPRVPTAGDTITLSMGPRGEILSGRVEDAEAGAIEGALVLQRDPRNELLDAAVSDAEGRFQMSAGPGGLDLEVAAGGYATSRFVFAVPPASPVLRLYPESAITGIVVDDGDQPVPHVTVALRPTAPGRRFEVDSTVAGPDGHFSFGYLEPAGYELSVADGHRRTAEPVPVRVELGGETEVRVPVVAGVRLAATLLTRSGDACGERASVTVQLGEGPTATHLRGTTTAPGAIEVAAIPPGRHPVRARCPGHKDVETQLELAADIEQTWTFEPEPHATGVVVDENGDPVDGVAVRVAQSDEATATDREGLFSLRLPLDGRVRLVAAHPDFPPAEAVDIGTATGLDIHGIRLELERGSCVELELAGDPALVSSVAAYGRRRGANAVRMGGGSGARRTLCGATEASPVTVEFREHWGPPIQMSTDGGTTWRPELQLHGDEQRVSITLRPHPTELQGRVLDADGAPVSGAIVIPIPGRHECMLRGTGRTRSVTDSGGSFELQGLPGGELTLVAATGESHGCATGAAGDAPIEIVLRPAD